MNTHTALLTRRTALLGALATASVSTLAKAATEITPDSGQSEFAFLTGAWKVHHHQLQSRLTGETQWWDFEGSCRLWPLLGGEGNVDDNILNHPKGSYRGVSIRHVDPKSREWSIWWIDSRSNALDPPVRGKFENGVGTFLGADELRGKPILVRFIWSDIHTRTPRWEQAFSPDEGKSWEVNWIMHFERQS
jgi:hypothetical protein